MEEAGKVVSGLKFTVDSQLNHADGWCPMLNLKVWKEVCKGGVVVIREQTCRGSRS